MPCAHVFFFLVCPVDVPAVTTPPTATAAITAAGATVMVAGTVAHGQRALPSGTVYGEVGVLPRGVRVPGEDLGVPVIETSRVGGGPTKMVASMAVIDTELLNQTVP